MITGPEPLKSVGSNFFCIKSAKISLIAYRFNEKGLLLWTQIIKCCINLLVIEREPLLDVT